MEQAKSVFKIIAGEQRPFSQNDEGGKLTLGTFVMSYEGDLKGQGVLGELKNYSRETTAMIYGLERVTGNLAGLSGSFVLEHIGKFENDMLVSKRTVVPGSGTNDLTGLRGDIDFVSGGATEFPIVLNYYFE